MELIKVDINELSNEEIEQIVGEFEVAINNYLEDKKDEILTLGAIIDFNIPNATDDEILDTINDVVCYNIKNELKKSFDASLVEQQEIVDSMVADYLEELFINKNCFVDYIPNEIIEIWENE